MNNDLDISEEEIISYLLGEVDNDKKLFIQRLISENPQLQEMERVLTDTIRLVEQSTKEPLPDLEEGELLLSQKRRNAILGLVEKEETLTLEKQKSSLPKDKKSDHFLFWVPLGIAACAFLILSVTDSDHLSTAEITLNREQESTSEQDELEGTTTDAIDIEEELALNLALENQAQEGVVQILTQRSTIEVEAMKRDLNNSLSIGDVLAYSEPIPFNSVEDSTSVVSPVPSSANRSAPPRVQSETLSKIQNLGADHSIMLHTKELGAELSVKKEKVVDPSPKPIIEDSVVPPLRTEQIEQNEDIIITEKKRKAAGSENSTQTNRTSSGRFQTQAIPQFQKGLISEYLPRLWGSSEPTYLFTSKGKTLGKVRIIKKTDTAIEFVRLNETMRGKSTLPDGLGYQLRLSDSNSSTVIIVGHLTRVKVAEIKNKRMAKSDLVKDLDFTTYSIQIEEAWKLDEKENRIPIK